MVSQAQYGSNHRPWANDRRNGKIYGENGRVEGFETHDLWFWRPPL